VRTTLDIDDDVLAASKELARRKNMTAGKVLSDLARKALTGAIAGDVTHVREPAARYGFQPFPTEGKFVSDELINDLRDREGI
jgi:hypothetical protein